MNVDKNSVKLFIYLGVLSGILSSLFQTGIIVAPGIFLLSGGTLGILIAFVTVLYLLYTNYITIMELSIYILSYLVSNFVIDIIKKIVL